MKNKYLRSNISGILFTSILGTLFHFLYEWSGQHPLIGFFTPVNESVWEHMKLLFFPMLLYFLFEKAILGTYPAILFSANAAALLSGTALIPVVFYTYSGILGTHHIALDIAVFYLSTILAFVIRRLLCRKRISKIHCHLLNACVLLILVCFLVFTFCPPSLGIFQPPA